MDDRISGNWQNAGRTPQGRMVSWRNDQSGNQFELHPRRTLCQDDRQCRKFDQVVYVDGRREVMEGITCKTEAATNWPSRAGRFERRFV